VSEDADKISFKRF
jgi:m7GpppX diphosphatase